MREEESRILAGVKERRRQLERAAEKKRDYKQEDFETLYRQHIREYQGTKEKIKERRKDLDNNQHKYIKRETEYRAVIDELHRKIKYHSTNPLQVQEEDKAEDVFRMKDIDKSDPEQVEALKREQQRKIENASLMEGGRTAKNIKDINETQDALLKQMSEAEKKFINHLKRERKEVLIGCDNKARETVDQLRKEEMKRNKDNQYNFKQKEKELKEHLETMTQVAQKIDDDNKMLLKKNEELKIQYMA